MQQESEMLTEKPFSTLILDEAQAIKNRTTKRSQAAMQLQADFKVITTGTPIENHLGELWNLFNFLNPGLLGSLDRFNETYAGPIERYQDWERRNQLRRLLQPFILRRRKNDVLDELPEKTEITLRVELSGEERAFYEALRRQAIERISHESGNAADQRFRILAELMRLRQAACHPRLVKADSEMQSSKLNLFADTVEELLDGGHKALVFSQFVKHLKIIEEWVQKRGIAYQYLDGSTPMGQRDKAIRAFQAGEGDLFLISLKAGGFGLNLTAADYVIHLDPWWNPAVEDQASDRAHRIGQQRPVTIYRLVAEDTIEDKIVKLHADKRELADSLLEGTEASGKLSADELLELIKS
jgi:SNF2 family DNA or RNA helicase